MNGLAAKSVFFCDRGSPGSPDLYSAAGQEWMALVEDWGALNRNIDETMLTANSSADLRLAILNTPVDFGGAQLQSFSELFASYPPEANVTATLYQWFESEGLGSGDLTALFCARVSPVEYDEEKVTLDLVALSDSLGDGVIGRTISLTEYPNAPSSSVGKTIPIVIGSVDGAPGIRVRDVAETEITVSVIPGATILSVKSTDLFPSSGQIIIDNDVITYTGKTLTIFYGCVSQANPDGGIANAHYNGDKVIQSISDHRYLFSDPTTPIKSIANVKVAGQNADPADYSIDLGRCEILFYKRPKKLAGVNSEFVALGFDTVAAGNSSVNATAAMNSNAATDHATINQVHPSLRLRRSQAVPNRGAIKTVRVGVEHFEEEKLPNDSLRVSLVSIVGFGWLSKPNSDDRIAVAGDTDITHNHVDTIGGNVDIAHQHGNNIGGSTNIQHGHTENLNFPLYDPGHVHQVFTDGERTLDQDAVGGLGVFQGPVNITFPSYSGTTLRADYTITFKLPMQSVGLTSSQTTGYLYLGGKEVYRKDVYPTTKEAYTNLVTINGNQSSTVQLSLAGIANIYGEIVSVKRRLIFTASTSSQAIVTGAATSKSGAVQNLSTTNAGLSRTGGVDPLPNGTDSSLIRTGGLDPLVRSQVLGNVVQEKASRAVIEYFDITQYATSWDWFVGQEISVDYIGSSDGRSAYIIHAFIDVEYAVPKYDYTDEITADVQGIVDVDGSVTGTAGTLIEKPEHVFLASLLAPLVGLTPSHIDTNSFSAAGSAFASAISGGYKLAGMINSQKTMKELWREWEREVRAYLYWDSLGKARLLYRVDNAVSAVTSTKSITPSMIRIDPATGKSSIKARRTLLSNVVNSIDLKYKKDWSAGNYAAVSSVQNPHSQGMYGIKQNPQLFEFNWTRSEAQAQNLAWFYLTEYARPLTIIEVEVFLDQLDVERGDIIDITHSLDNMAGHKALVLEVNREMGSGKSQKMDTMTLIARLFAVDYIFSSVADAVSVSDALAPFSLAMSIPESASAAEATSWSLQESLAESVSATDGLTPSIFAPLTEAVDTGDSISTLSVTHPETETVTAIDAVKVEANSGGFGVQSFGNSPFGDMISLGELYSQASDSVTVGDGLDVLVQVNLVDGITASETMTIRFDEVVNVSDIVSYPNEGFGNQWFGSSGFGGLTRVA